MWKGSLLLVRFTLFGCGGTAITFSTSHKIMDLTSFVTLLQSWISACSGTTPTVLPDLHIGSSRLPSILDMSQMPTSVVLSTKKLTSRRLVFSAFKVRELKTKVFNAFRDQEFSYYPSRVEVVTAFLWKFALEAFISTRKETTFRPSVFIQAVNVRPRMEPPLPQNAIGNLAWLFPVIVENEKGHGVY
ncbi:vinorine synthase-like [Quillaja saponaria]|uniref:Vinorine synthase-like n=1 Tax=Quillaja saponaria TaxID=32244 RepID=A0AAD7LV23_QUISA|nr:vinorine synthase-like [Quillaja saponaria]